MNLFQLIAHFQYFQANAGQSLALRDLCLADPFLSLPTQAALVTDRGQLRYQLSGLVGLFGALPYQRSEELGQYRWHQHGEALSMLFEGLARRSATFELQAWALDHDLCVDDSRRRLGLRRSSPAMADIEVMLQASCHRQLRIIPFYPARLPVPSPQQFLGITSYLAATMICRQSTLLIDIGPMSIPAWASWWQVWGRRLDILRAHFPKHLVIKLACRLRDQVTVMRLSRGLCLGWNTLLNTQRTHQPEREHCFVLRLRDE